MYQAGFDPRAMPSFSRSCEIHPAAGQRSIRLSAHSPVEPGTHRRQPGACRSAAVPAGRRQHRIPAAARRAAHAARRAAKAIEYYSGMLQQGKFSSEPAYRYGFTLALLQAKEYVRRRAGRRALRNRYSTRILKNWQRSWRWRKGRPPETGRCRSTRPALNLTHPIRPGLVSARSMRCCRPATAIVRRWPPLPNTRAFRRTACACTDLKSRHYAALWQPGTHANIGAGRYYSGGDGNPREALTQTSWRLVAGSDFYLQSGPALPAGVARNRRQCAKQQQQQQ